MSEPRSSLAHSLSVATPATLPSPRGEPHHVLASLAKQRVHLELATVDLCFVAALHLRSGGAALVSFEEAELSEVFEQVCATIDAGSPPPPSSSGSVVRPPLVGSEFSARRATHAIRRLREQRLLTRVDGAGVVRSGHYALSRLAVSIAEFYLHDEALTRESLTLLTRTLLASLGEVREQAQAASNNDEWTDRVLGPLRITVADLVAGIERRQRGFDVQQEDYQREIGRLLQGDWFGAIERCQSLLESTSGTLRELNVILLRDAHQLTSVLQDIQELAIARGIVAGEAAAREVMDQVDRIAHWGAARQRAWSEYYQYVHRFLRDVVRLDPERLLSQRLREQLAGKTGRPFALVLAAAPSIRLLRAVAPSFEKPPVRRPRKEREPLAEGAEAEKVVDAIAQLESDVQRALAEGAADLVSVTSRVTDALAAPGDRYATAGRVAEAVAKCRAPRARPPRPWVSLGGLVIENWKWPATDEAS